MQFDPLVQVAVPFVHCVDCVHALPCVQFAPPVHASPDVQAVVFFVQSVPPVHPVFWPPLPPVQFVPPVQPAPPVPELPAVQAEPDVQLLLPAPVPVHEPLDVQPPPLVHVSCAVQALPFVQLGSCVHTLFAPPPVQPPWLVQPCDACWFVHVLAVHADEVQST